MRMCFIALGSLLSIACVAFSCICVGRCDFLNATTFALNAATFVILTILVK